MTSVPILFHLRRMADSLRVIFQRVHADMLKGISAPGVRASVAVYDLGVVLETVKRYGGRADWRPTPQAIDQLAPPVRRYILSLEAALPPDFVACATKKASHGRGAGEPSRV